MSLGPGWQEALAPVAAERAALLERIALEREAGAAVVPPAELVERAFETPFDQVRVVILGQDPYPGEGHAVGLAFSVDRSPGKLPPSLRNILREWHDDLGLPMPGHGDLGSWQQSGVLLLNTALTSLAHQPGAHANYGWDAIIRQALRALAAREQALVAILWGANAQRFAKDLGSVPCILSAHPSPLSARRGFFGSRPFSRANALLLEQGAAPIDWRLR